MTWRVELGDCVERMRALDECSVDAVVCDPPYHLAFMGREWDTVTPGQSQHEHERWAREALRVLKPGGHLLAFGGTRTYHRLACAVEDAGFEIRDTIAWMYGSGFPKSLDVSKAIDKANGKPLDRLREFGAFVRASREAAGLTQAEVNREMGMPQGCGWWEGKGAGEKWDLHPPSRETWARLKALYGIDGEWDWFIEWNEAEREKIGTKPSSLGGTVAAGERDADYIARHRSMMVDITAPATPEAAEWQGWGTALKPAHEPIVVARKPLSRTVAGNVLEHGCGALNVDGCRIEGRWPANVVLDGEAAEALDQQTGERPPPGGPGKQGVYPTDDVYGDGTGTLQGPLYFDSGGASRFFYVAKASSAERNAGLDGFEEREASSGSGNDRGARRVPGGWEYDREPHPRRNVHPTVKPIDLMRWLVRLVCPPGGTVLDPFTGSGTTGAACMLEGFDFIGIEREPEYADIARARIAWWSEHPDGMKLVQRLEAEAERKSRADAGQLSLEVM